MTFEAPAIYVLGLIVFFITVVTLRLKKVTTKRSLAVGEIVLLVSFMIGNTIFPITISSVSTAFQNQYFNGFLPLANLLRSTIQFESSDGSVITVYYYRNLIVKYFVMDFAVAALVGADIYYLKRKKRISMVLSWLIVVGVISIKILFIVLGMSKMQIFDTAEILLALLGGLMGVFCMTTILKYGRSRKNESYN